MCRARLAIGEADVEIRVRANNQESETATLKATITDATASMMSPNANAPRVLMVSPARVGAGQSMMLSLDYRRTLNPDPAKTVVVIEQGSARYIVPIERSSLKFGPAESDAPVLFFLRPTAGDYRQSADSRFQPIATGTSGMSEPVPIEILSEPLPPDLLTCANQLQPTSRRCGKNTSCRKARDEPFPSSIQIASM